MAKKVAVEGPREPQPKLMPFERRTIVLELRGATPLLSANREGVPTTHTPAGILRALLFELPDGSQGFPVLSIKGAVVSLARSKETRGTFLSRVIGVQQVRQGFMVEGYLAPLKGNPKLKAVLVDRNGKRMYKHYAMYRPPWSIRVPVIFNTAIFSAEQVLELFSLAGEHSGLGFNRPEHGGDYGKFTAKLCR